MSLRIGIEASRVTQVGLGIDRHILCLLRALGRVDRVNKYTLFSNYKDLAKELNLPGNFQVEHPKKRLRMIYRSGVGIIGKTLFKNIDIFHFPNSDIWHSKYTRTITTIHDLAPLHYPEIFFPDKKGLKRFKKKTFYFKKNADMIITVSESSKFDIVEKLNITPDRIKVIYNGVENKFRQIEVSQEMIERINLKFNTGKDFILFVGRLDFRKNLKALIRAFGLLIRKRPDLRHKLVIVGKKPEENLRLSVPLEEIVKQSGLTERVVFAGSVNDEELTVLYNLAQLFIFPSIFEGFGLPALEAMACGCPVIVSDIAPLAELTDNAAIKVSPSNIDELAEKIQGVLSSDAARAEFRQKGLKRALVFSWDKSAQELIRTYEHVAGL